jgi:subtilisin family serine protease
MKMSKMRSGRKILNIALVLAFVLSFSVTAFAQEGGGLEPTPLEPESTYSVGTDSKATSGLSSAAPSGEPLVSLIVKLDVDSLAAYSGGLPGLPATNPKVTGAKKLNPKSKESQAYLNYLQKEQKNFKAAVKSAIKGAQVTQQYDVVFGGAALLVPESQVEKVASLPDVVAVYPDELQHIDTETSPYFIGADALWEILGGQESAGEGITVGVIDSGIWPEHPSFSDPDVSGKPYDPPAVIPGSNGIIGERSICDFGNTAYNPADAPFTCNNKLIGAYSFIDTYKAITGLPEDNFDSARDDDGHGTHTSSTAAGNANVEASIFDIPRGMISGIAPRAHIVMYRALVEGSGYSSDLMRAAQQATLDQVDAINYSISGGGNPYSDSVSLAFLDAYTAGVFVAASAGNSGPAPDTTDHREPWTTTVAASTTDRQFQSTVSLVADGGDELTLTGASITPGIDTSTPVIFPPEGEELCLDPFPAGTFDGEIVICERGIIARVAKSYNVAQGGAGGLLLYNPSLQGLATDNHFIPAVHLEVDAGDDLLEFMTSHTGVTGTFTQGAAVPAQGDVIASFSSRGGPGQTLGISKPDVTAPGVQILAGMTPDPTTIDGGKPGQYFQAIQGTSMSSPHVVGAAALIKALHPDWTPGQIKSALMTSAKTSDVVKEDGVTPADPFDYGSGRIDLSKIAGVGLTFDETAANYVALQHELWNANYPSLYIPVMPGLITVQRTVHNELDRPGCWEISVDSPPDLKVGVEAKICMESGGERAFSIAVDAHEVPLGEVRFATLKFTRDQEELHFPITIVRRQPVVTMEKSCDPATLSKNGLTDCTINVTNTSFEEASVSLIDRLPKELNLVAHSVIGAKEEGNRFIFEGSLYGAEPPDVTVSEGSSNGYLSLASLGADPNVTMTDESIVNFNLPAALVFAGETYTRIGMVSDGYAVVGGGTGADIEYINQDLPDPTRPNNVLAPFWTDLNGSAGGNYYAYILSDGVSSWFVMEWEDAPNYSSSSDSPQLNTFQIWVGLNGVEDISFAYGPTLTAGEGGYLTVGAENQYGNRGQNYYFDGTGTLPLADGKDVIVSSVPGEPGETHTITFAAEGRQPGEWENCAVMTGNLFFGASTACFSGEVTR